MNNNQARKRLVTFEMVRKNQPESQIRQVAEVSHSTVWRCKLRLQNGQSWERRPGSGRSKKLADEHIEALVTRLIERPSASSRELAAWLNGHFEIEVSRTTICAALKKYGLNCWSLRKVPLLSAAHRQKRVQWCLDYQGHDWQRTFFSDETYFELDRNKNRYWAVERPLLPAPHRSKKVGVWGAFSGCGKSPLYFFESSIDSEHYQAILNECLVDNANVLCGENQWWFQQDNARPHTSRATKAYMEARGIKTIDWPAMSPDLNPIENIWSRMKIAVEKEQPKSFERLKETVLKVWDSLELEDLAPYVQSMPNRLDKCIAAQGFTIDY